MDSSRVRLLSLAVAGAVCGHTLAYAASYPDRMVRDAVLRVTGHAYWHAAVAAALLGAAWFVVDHVGRNFDAGRRRGTVERGTLGPTFARLAVVQLGVFAGMEVLERLTAGADLSTLAARHVLTVGVASQVLVALALATATWLVARAARALGAIFAADPRTWARSLRVAAAVQHTPRRLAVVPCGTRGPPAS